MGMKAMMNRQNASVNDIQDPLAKTIVTGICWVVLLLGLSAVGLLFVSVATIGSVAIGAVI